MAIVFIIINLLCMGFSWWVASRCEQWTALWWFNMFASALNAVVAFNAIGRLM